MLIFLDSADLNAIEKYTAWGVVDGVTTNPSIIAKSGATLKTRIQAICKLVTGPVSCEVMAEDVAGMLEQGRLFAQWAENIYVKVPMTAAGLEVVKILTAEGIHTNVTLIFNPMQALLAAKAGASLVSPFVGRLDDIGEHGMQLVAEIVQIFDIYDIETKVLAASLRNVKHVFEATACGADIATIPPILLEQMILHPLTTSGLEQFNRDSQSIQI